jgi:hypothetical protein
VSVAEELGPTVPSRGSIRFAAQKAARISAVILEITVEGPRCDVPRAARLMDELRAIVGPARENDHAD